MFSNIRYVLLTATRDRLFIGLLVGIALAAYISSVLGSTAMLETEQMTLAFTWRCGSGDRAGGANDYFDEADRDTKPYGVSGLVGKFVA